jgi:hypothetical protein
MRLPCFLLLYRASTGETTGMMPGTMVFGRKLCLPCDLLFGVPLDKDQLTTAYVADLVEQLHDIRYNSCQHLNVTSNRIKAHYDHLINTTGFQEGDQLWMYHLFLTREKSPKLHSSWEGTFRVITWISDVVYRIQCHPRVKMMVVYVDRVVLRLGATQDKQP